LVPVLLVSGVASVGSPAPGPVVISGPVLLGAFTLLASFAGGFAPPQPTLAKPHTNKSTATLDRIITRFLCWPLLAADPVLAACAVPGFYRRISMNFGSARRARAAL
jgi:hypothetical protein